MPPKSKNALSVITEGGSVAKAGNQLGTSGSIGKNRAYGGKIAAGSGAAALGGATAMSDDNSNNNVSLTDLLGGAKTGGTAVVPQQYGNADGEFTASLQHLEAPINAAITEWLSAYAPNIGAMLRITGLTPTQLVDGIVKRFHRTGVQPTPANVHHVALDVLDSAEERAAIRTDDQLMNGSLDDNPNILTPNHPLYRRTATAIAEIEAAADTLPGGIHQLLKIRAALQQKPEDFVAAVQLRYGFNPEVITGDDIQDRSERVMMR